MSEVDLRFEDDGDAGVGGVMKVRCRYCLNQSPIFFFALRLFLFFFTVLLQVEALDVGM